MILIPRYKCYLYNNKYFNPQINIYCFQILFLLCKNENNHQRMFFYIIVTHQGWQDGEAGKTCI